ncbi:hypothetical protein AMTRI_Chr04g180720 [Amborella trichopoda]
MALAKLQALSLLKPHYVFSLLIPFPSFSSSFELYSTKTSLLTPSPSLTGDGLLLSASPSSSSSSSIVNLLMDSLGLSKESALAVASSSRLGLNKPTKNPICVLKFLKDSGFHDAHICSIVTKSPKILVASVEKTLKPKFEMLEDLGLSGPDLGEFLSPRAFMVYYSAEKRIAPIIEFLKSYLKTNENVLRVLRSNWVLSFRIEERILPNMRCIESYGVGPSQLQQLAIVHPRLLSQNPKRTKQNCEKIIEMGFNPKSLMFAHALHAFSSMNNEKWQAKVDFFKSFGCSQDHVFSIFRRAPYTMCLSVKKLKETMGYFVKKQEDVLFNLIMNPQILGFSLGGRVIPRNNVLQALRLKKLLKKDVKLSSVCLLSERRFLQKFVGCFGEEADYLRRIYEESKGNPEMIL